MILGKAEVSMARRKENIGVALRDLLLRLVRERLARKPGGHLVESQLETLDLRLRLDLRGPEADEGRFTERLIRHVDDLLDDAVQRAAAFRPGHTYCHRCESVECDHSRPPSPRHVFTGFSPTGTPHWDDFGQYCLDSKHPRVEQLFDEPPALLALVLCGDDLHGGMLDSFRSPSYELLGQTVAGFFPVRARDEEGRSVLALTVQVAAWHSPTGAPKLGLNLLGCTPTGESLEFLWDRLGDPPWRRAVRWAQAALQTIPRVGRNGREELEGRVRGILNGFARRVEREQRSRSRRTRHAEQRHKSGERPTRKALDDAREVDRESLLLDERSGTIVVLGERGRTHFFTRDGQLVSSVRYSREAIARKLKLRLWKPAPEEVRESFRERLAT